MIRITDSRTLAGMGAVCTFIFTICAGCNMQATPTGLEPQQRRFAFQSQCAQNAVECTTSWPTPAVRINALDGQIITGSDTTFEVTALSTNGSVMVQLIGSDSTPGDGATGLLYSWTHNATDTDVCSLEPGVEFSTDADPVVELQEGFHYIRLTVQNDIRRDEVPVEGCDIVLEDVLSFDFIEIEIEVDLE